MNGRRSSISLAILILVVSVPPLLTYRQGQLIAWGDMDIPELGVSRSIEDLFYVWQGRRALGSFMPLAWPEILPHYFLVWLLREGLGIPPPYTQAILYTLCFVLAAVSTFFLVRTILPQQRHFLAAVIAGVLYIFNLSFLQITWGGMYRFIFSHAMLPLFLAIYACGLQSGDRKFLAFWAITLFLGTGGLYPLPVGLSFVAVLVFYTTFAAWIYGKKVWLRSIEFTIIGVLTIAMWLLPLMKFLLGGGGEAIQESGIRSIYNEVFSEAQQNMHLFINIFRPFNWQWFQFEGYSQGKPETLFPFADSYMTMPTLIIGSFLLPVFAFASALFKKKRESEGILFFLGLSIGCLLLMKAAAPPLQQAFILLNQIPFFSGLYREPYNKLQAIFTLGYAVLAGYTLNMLRMKIQGDSMGRRLLSFAGSLLPVGLVMALVFPYWQGQVIRPRRISVPEEYYAVANTLNSDNEDYRVLSLPFFVSTTFVSYQWGYSGASDIMPYLLNRSIFSSAHTVGSPLAEHADALLRKAVAEGDEATFSTLVYLYSMGKIIVHRDADPNRYKEEFPFKQIERLMSSDSITFVSSFGELDLYNADTLPYLYATTDIDCVAEDAGAAVVIPFGLLRTTGPSRVLVDACSAIEAAYSPRVFVLAQADTQNDRYIDVTVPISATYESFSSLPVACSAGSGLNYNGNQWGNSTRINETNLYSSSVLLALEPGTYRCHSAIQANDTRNPGQPPSKGVLILRSVEVSHGNEPAPIISYTRINPTRYRIEVEGATSPFMLVLAESYHTAWKAFVDGQEVSEIYHRRANGYANAWLIDTKGNYQVTLEFTPQRLVYIGLVISCLVVLLSLIYLKYRLSQAR